MNGNSFLYWILVEHLLGIFRPQTAHCYVLSVPSSSQWEAVFGHPRMHRGLWTGYLILVEYLLGIFRLQTTHRYVLSVPSSSHLEAVLTRVVILEYPGTCGQDMAEIRIGYVLSNTCAH